MFFFHPGEGAPVGVHRGWARWSRTSYWSFFAGCVRVLFPLYQIPIPNSKFQYIIFANLKFHRTSSNSKFQTFEFQIPKVEFFFFTLCGSIYQNHICPTGLFKGGLRIHKNTSHAFRSHRGASEGCPRAPSSLRAYMGPGARIVFLCTLKMVN